MDELGGEACCVASRTLTCTAVEVAQLCTVDCMPFVAARGRELAQPVHVLLKACTGDTLKTLRDPELVGTSSDTGMCVVCTFDLFVCKVLCFQWVCFLFVYICLQYMHMQSELVVLCVVT